MGAGIQATQSKRASAVIKMDRASVLLRAASKLQSKRASAVINIKVHWATVLVQWSIWIEQACMGAGIQAAQSKCASAVINMDRASMLLRADIQAAQQTC